MARHPRTALHGRALAALLVLLLVPAVRAAPGGPVDAVSAEQAYRQIVELAAAPRPAGSDAERRAAEHLARVLQGYGYAVELQPFEVRAFEVVRSDLALVRPEARAVAASPLDRSPSSGGPIEAGLVAVGIGDEAGFAGREARGRVALIERGTITFHQKVRNAEAAGAVAAIIYNNQPGPFAGTLGEPTRIAALAVSREDGLRLAAAAGQGATVRLDVETRTRTATSHNVVATKPGPQGARVVVVGAHYDSVPQSPGANDNASGTAVMLEVARVFRDVPLPFTVRFVAFGAEEIGLVGSRAYVERSRDQMLAMLNLDMEGIGQRFVAATTGDDGGLGARAVRVAQRLGIGMAQIEESRSDHASFARAGVPAVLIHRPSDPLIHTPQDRAERIEPGLLVAPLRVTAALLLDLAGR